jgi:Ras-related protein Rap-1B
MKTGQGFLLVFSITSLSSLYELHALRDQILRIKGSTSVPIVLVGNKSDLEEDRAVTRARAFQVSQTWGRVPYYETSARRRANVDEVFRDLCRQIIRKDMENHARASLVGDGAYRESGGNGDGAGQADSSKQGVTRTRRSKSMRKKQRKKGDKDGGPSCTIL